MGAQATRPAAVVEAERVLGAELEGVLKLLRQPQPPAAGVPAGAVPCSALALRLGLPADVVPPSHWAAVCTTIQLWIGPDPEPRAYLTAAECAVLVVAIRRFDCRDMREFTAALLAGSSPGSPPCEPFPRLLRAVVALAVGDALAAQHDRLTQALVVSVLRQTTAGGGHKAETDPTNVSQPMVDRWLTTVASVMDLFGSAFESLACRHGKPQRSTPLVLPVLKGGHEHNLLTPLDAWMLGRYLPSAHRDDWSLIFSARKQGLGYSTLRHQLIEAGTTTVVVFRDKQGHVFGGFAPEPWTSGPSFAGSDGAFLFTLQPKLAVYPSTGQNKNFQFLYAPRGATSSSTLPVGLGMGGQLDWFGLFVSDDLRGHSKAVPACSTFGSPQLSANQTFVVDDMEAWRIGPAVVTEAPDPNGFKASILDGASEDKALLEMTGKKLHSEGLRDTPDDD